MTALQPARCGCGLRGRGPVQKRKIAVVHALRGLCVGPVALRGRDREREGVCRYVVGKPRHRAHTGSQSGSGVQVAVTLYTHTAPPPGRCLVCLHTLNAMGLLPVSGRGDARVAPPCPTTLCVWRNLPYLTLPLSQSLQSDSLGALGVRSVTSRPGPGS